VTPDEEIFATRWGREIGEETERERERERETDGSQLPLAFGYF